MAIPTLQRHWIIIFLGALTFFTVGILITLYATDRRVLEQEVIYKKLSPVPTIYPTGNVFKKPTGVIEKDLQSCLEEVNVRTNKAYNDFCEMWKKRENSNDCPGMDLVEDPSKECYERFK